MGLMTEAIVAEKYGLRLTVVQWEDSLGKPAKRLTGDSLRRQ